MLYNAEDLMLFSLIYVDVIDEIYHTPKINHTSLYKIFFYSLFQNKNIFKLNSSELKILLKESIYELKLENVRIDHKKRLSNCINYFLTENGEKNIERLKIRVSKEFQICKLRNIKIIDYFSENYPKNLKNIIDPPFIIFFKGNLPKDDELSKSLAIVGSRNPDKKYGRTIARRVGIALAKQSWWNISGLAVGCDEFGHKGSIEGGWKTGAVLGQGLATLIYPEKSKRLSEQILENSGFILSELPPYTPKLSLFLKLRNRIQSGMTCGIFVVETSNFGGTLHTIKYSLKQKRKTIIWDPSDIIGLVHSKKVLGNMILIEGRKEALGVSISAKLRKQILILKYSTDIYKIINHKIDKKMTLF